MGRLRLVVGLLCTALMSTSAVRGQYIDFQPRTNLKTVANGGQEVADSETVQGNSDAVIEASQDDGRLLGSTEINPPVIAGGQSQFQSPFAITAPGSGIGSNFFGLEDDFSQGLLIKSENVAMKVGGYLKVDFIQDFNPIGNTDAFDVTTIEVGAPGRKNTRFHARQTRLYTDTRWLSDLGPIRVFIEGDFFFNQRQSAQLGENRFRLRQAYAEHGHWIVGQTWTTLSDIAASPATLDFEGQVASVTTRRTQIRWTSDIGDTDWSISLALEDPFTIIDPPEGVTGDAQTQTPDAVFRFRRSGNKTQFQMAGVVRQLGFQPTGQPVLEKIAWGLNFTDVTQVTDKSKIYFEVLYGAGISSFKGLSDVGTTTSGTAELIGSLGWMIGGTHNWNERLFSNVTFAQNRTVNVDDLSANEINNVTYFAANLICEPTQNTSLGIEYLYGLRENFDGQSTQANRIQMAFTYILP